MYRGRIGRRGYAAYRRRGAVDPRSTYHTREHCEARPETGASSVTLIVHTRLSVTVCTMRSQRKRQRRFWIGGFTRRCEAISSHSPMSFRIGASRSWVIVPDHSAAGLADLARASIEPARGEACAAVAPGPPARRRLR